MLDLIKLKTFQVVAATGSLTRAAAKLGYSQSNVTTHIKALEQELGRTLFERSRTGVALTESGRRALDYAGRLLTLEAEAKVLIHEPQNPSGVLHLSAPESLLSYRLPKVLQQYRHTYPDVQLSILSNPDVESHIIAVASGAAELAFVIDEPLESDRVEVEVISDEEIVVVVGAGHPLLGYSVADSAQLDIRAVQESEMLLCDTVHGYHLSYSQAILGQNKHFRTLELGSTEAVKRCTMAGVGFAVLPRFAVEQELASSELFLLPGLCRPFNAKLQLLAPKDRMTLPAGQELRQFARRELAHS
ncbi:MAG: LysR family transcriptional regulator [Acidobacteriota bacterium]